MARQEGVAAIRFCMETLGCKVNQFEAQALETILTARGHTAAAPGSGCHAVIINTCAVTAESGRKSRQAVRRLKKLEPDAVVAVCGCYSQLEPDEAAALGADLVAGSADRRNFVDLLERIADDKTARIVIDDPKKRRTLEQLPAGSAEGRTRAMLKIQDGCHNFCTYCIIPYARGPVRSLPPEAARAEAARLDAEGYREIVVTGIEISSYGIDLPGRPTLTDVVNMIGATVPNARIRLGSLEPTIITEDVCAALAAIPNLCHHFHLSLQSGCDDTLRRMKRRYTTGLFYNAVTMLRRFFPDCGITADLIVGFPGETEDDFNETLSFIKQCAFSSMHIFPFSPRPGTPAAEMPGQIAKDIKRARAQRAHAAADDMARAFADGCIGKKLDVLFERETQRESTGHAGNYLQVRVCGTGLKGGIFPVKITAQQGLSLRGECAEP